MWRLVVLSILQVAVTDGVEMKRIPVVAVTGVEGGSAALPCEVSHPPHDAVYLLLWFKDPLTTPIYRLDERWEAESHWQDESQLGQRALLEVSSTQAVLRVSSLTLDDHGLYTCRVDFRSHPTRTTRVNLTVVVPPERVSVVVGDTHPPQRVSVVVGEVYTSRGSVSSSVVGPYLEGDVIKLTCVAHGGSPRPSVVWYGGSHLLDTHMESRVSEPTSEPLGASTLTTLAPGPTTTQPTFGGEPFNTLTLGPLSRSHLQLLLTCEAANNNLTSPTSLLLTIDMNLAPLSVEIQRPDSLALRAGREYLVDCVVVGARPPPAITWWSGHQRVLQATVTTSEDNNVTVSTVVVTPEPPDNGSFLRCIAETYAAPATLEDTWALNVHYVPSASCRFGSSLDAANIKEGDDVYLECSTQANPRVTHVSWRHNEAPLVHNVSAGVIVSNHSLVLQRLVRAQAGRYSCLAHNPIGDGVSNSLRLDVKFAPVCSPRQVTTYAVDRYEDAEVTCSVDANPVQESFQWTFNNTADTIDVPQGRFTSLSTHSVITYTPMTALDYGTLLCWAINELGPQKEPCVFHIVPAGKPEPPGECRVEEGTRTSVRVRCGAGSSGGLPQHFLLQASSLHHHHHHLLNFTSFSSPDFYVDGLEAEGKYQLVIRAVNEKGISSATRITVSSVSTNGSVYQLHDGPLEAEVRDGGTSVNEASQETIQDVLALPSFIMGVLGVGSGLVLLVILVLLFITLQGRRPPQPRPLAHHLDTEEHPAGGSSPTGTSPVLTPEQQSTCLERDVMHQVEPESDADPDVIPLQEACQGCDGGAIPAATVLPSHHYKYDPVPALQPTSVCVPVCHHHQV